MGSVGPVRLISVVLGLVVMGLGLYSHFDSDWVKPFSDDGRARYSYYRIQPTFEDYFCKSFQRSYAYVNCPDKAFELYFVSIIIICGVVSLIGFALTCMFGVDLRHDRLKFADFSFHLIGGLLLLAGGILFIISAQMIDKVTAGGRGRFQGYQFRWTEKIAAGSLAIAQAAVYFCMALLIKRQGKRSVEDY